MLFWPFQRSTEGRAEVGDPPRVTLPQCKLPSCKALQIVLRSYDLSVQARSCGLSEPLSQTQKPSNFHDRDSLHEDGLLWGSQGMPREGGDFPCVLLKLYMRRNIWQPAKAEPIVQSAWLDWPLVAWHCIGVEKPWPLCCTLSYLRGERLCNTLAVSAAEPWAAPEVTPPLGMSWDSKALRETWICNAANLLSGSRKERMGAGENLSYLPPPFFFAWTRAKHIWAKRGEMWFPQDETLNGYKQFLRRPAL